MEQIRLHGDIVFGDPVQYSNLPKLVREYMMYHKEPWDGKRVFVQQKYYNTHQDRTTEEQRGSGAGKYDTAWNKEIMTKSLILRRFIEEDVGDMHNSWAKREECARYFPWNAV